MNIDEQLDITIKRDYYVVKSNHLIQKSRYGLSIKEQRAIAYICSMIKPVIATPATYNAPYQLDYEFDIREYAKICGLHLDSGYLYNETKSLLRGLKQKVMWLELPDGTEVTVGWLAKAWINKRSGIVKIRLDEDLVPYLFDLQEKYTSYILLNILAMKSQYSIRIYEILRSHSYQKVTKYEIDKLKKMLMVEDVKSYNRFPDFRRKVLGPAMAEINEYTDLTVSYEPITKGRKVIKIKFHINKKATFDRFIAQTKANDEITTY